MEITKVKAREIIDSRGNPTVEVDIHLKGGAFGRASVPSGASTGVNEALELRDTDSSRYNNKGVLKAVENVNTIIAEAIEGTCALNQREVDRILIELDGTPNKSKLGANAILGVSLAVAKAAADYLKLPLFKYIGGVNARMLPIPMMNIVNGGSHSDAPIAFQEFMIRPIGAKSMKEAIEMGANIFHALKKLIAHSEMSTAVGDEGGFAPKFSGAEEALNYIQDAIKACGYTPGKEVTLALDCAASEFYNTKTEQYEYSKFEGYNGVNRIAQEQVDYLEDLISRFPIDSIEDGMAEEDWAGWRLLTERIGAKCQLVGDDLFVTNVSYLERGIKDKCANAILIKVNQIGTLSETLDAVELAQKNGYATIISHRSGETEDTTIADIAVATNSKQIKTGSMSRTDRVCKSNQLLRIEEILLGE